VNSPPAARPLPATSGSSPRSETPSPNCVLVLNAYWSGRPEVKRKIAERMVSVGRALWVDLADGSPMAIRFGPKALRLVMSHRTNAVAVKAVEFEYDEKTKKTLMPMFGRSDLRAMRAGDPERYEANWRGSARASKGAVQKPVSGNGRTACGNVGSAPRSGPGSGPVNSGRAAVGRNGPVRQVFRSTD
jgi:hypothetical protein